MVLLAVLREAILDRVGSTGLAFRWIVGCLQAHSEYVLTDLLAPFFARRKVAMVGDARLERVVGPRRTNIRLPAGVDTGAEDLMGHVDTRLRAHGRLAVLGQAALDRNAGLSLAHFGYAARVDALSQDVLPRFRAALLATRRATMVGDAGGR